MLLSCILAVVAGLLNFVVVGSMIAAQVTVLAYYFAIPFGIIVEQVVLFAIFLTSRRARAKLTGKKRATILPQHENQLLVEMNQLETRVYIK